jgi:MoxR-like ATPase
LLLLLTFRQQLLILKGELKMTEVQNLPQCWQDVQDAINAGIDRLILFGPPGTGKTYAGLHYGDIEAGAWRLICTEDMTNGDVTGHYIPSGNEWSWKDGSAVKAWQGDGIRGGRLVVDEIDKAGGDVFATLLAMTDTPDSAKWERPSDGRTIAPKDGFSVVMTTNVEDMRELPEALRDRFPVAIRINQPHPSAIALLSRDLQGYAVRMADAGERRISLRTFYAFDKLRKSLGDERAAQMILGQQAQSFVDAIAIDKVGV